MTATKPRAYLAPTGNELVTAWSVAKERDARYRGEPTGETFYSMHQEGRRKPMSHVYPRGGIPFFRYINGSDEHEGGPGESLEHSLFKEAVASISHTRLSLGKYGNHRIRVSQGVTEKKIMREGRPYFSDVHLHFESDTELGVKWGGELHVEIRRTHAVDAVKLNDIGRLRIPMIEVPIPKRLLYEFGDEGTTDEREEAYRQGIKRMLESEKGYLEAVVLSDPSSVEHMEGQLAAAQVALREAAAHARTASDELAGSRAAQVRLSKQLAAEQAVSHALRSEATTVAQLVSLKIGRVRELEVELQTTREELRVAGESMDSLNGKLRKIQAALWVMGCMALAGCLYGAFSGVAGT